MSRKNRTYSPEEYFIPKDNRPPVIHIPGREEDMVEIPGEKDVTVLETEGGEIASSQEVFGLFKKKDNKSKYVREMNSEVFYYLDNTYNQRKPESLDSEIKRLEAISKVERKGTLWSNQDIEDFKKTTKLNISSEVIDFLRKYSDITKPFTVYKKDRALDTNFIPEALNWVEDVSHSAHQKVLKDLDSISPCYPIVDISDDDTYSWLVLTPKGLMTVTIHGDETHLFIDNQISDMGNNPKAKVTIANVIFSKNINHNWEKEYYAEQYKLGKWNPPIPSKESIQDKFTVTLGIESVGDAMDTPLVIKGNDETDDKMTADDLTTDPNKVEELKEEFGDPSDKTDDADTGDSGSTDETPDSETEENDTSEDTSGSKETVEESSDDTENKEKEDNEDSNDKEDKEEKDNEDSKDAAETTDDNTEEK